MSSRKRGGNLVWLGIVSAAVLISVCDRDDDSVAGGGAEAVADTAPYAATVDEGLGTAVAIVLDNSGSMEEEAPGDDRAKYLVAREALEQMLTATEGVLRERPGYPVRVAVYQFSSGVTPVLPMQPYDRDSVRAAIARLSPPSGGTAIGEAMDAARRDLYASGVFRKYILVVTDGENTDGRDPADVGREISRRSQGAVQVYFVAFDTDPEKFGFLKEIGGDVLAARGGAELQTALAEVYRGKILAEAADYGEGAPAADTRDSATTPESTQQ